MTNANTTSEAGRDASACNEGLGLVPERATVSLTLADLQILAATASRNDTHHAFQAVALEWCGKAQAEIDRLRAADAALADVAMMLKTCAWALRRGSSPDLGERALVLLKKHGLLGTPLRDETLDEAGAAAAALYDRWTGKA